MRRTDEAVTESQPGRSEPARHWRWVGPAVFVALLAAASIGYSIFHGSGTRPRTAPPPSVGPSSSAPAIPGTVAAFAALSAGQQKAIMQQEIDRYNSVLDQAYRQLDLSVLPEVATGTELSTQQQQLQALKAQGKPSGEQGSYSILSIAAAPALGSVSVSVRATDSTWWLDPKTLQPNSPPNVTTSTRSYTFVPEEGTWKVQLVASQ